MLRWLSTIAAIQWKRWALKPEVQRYFVARRPIRAVYCTSIYLTRYMPMLFSYFLLPIFQSSSIQHCTIVFLRLLDDLTDDFIPSN